MKQTRLALVLVATSLATTPAIAASLTMLQFGSFETRAEAEKRLSDISKKHAAVVGKLGSTIREVKLPPDNLTVYRTQAGPVENRAAAQTICATLAGAGDECYIVQTAMVAAADAAKPVAASTAPVEAAATAAVAEVKTELAKAAPLKEDLTSKLSTLKEPSLRDASNIKALESVTAPTLDAPVSAAVAAPALAEPSAEMKSALDKAASEKVAVENSINKSTEALAPKPRASFWSRLNPFSSDEEKLAPVEVVKAPEPMAAPVEAVTAQAIEAPVIVSAPVAAAAIADSSPVVTQAEPMRLPPPPAPLKARDRELLAAAKSAPSEPAQTGALPAVPVAEVKPLQPTSGTVQVEEAKRVPVTSTTEVAPVQPVQASVPTVVVPSQPAVSLSPSATDGLKTIWAQIGPFADSDAALAYWAKYRQMNPDFPVVRVRVTTPLAQQVRGSTQSWLRVGPVMRAGFVKSLCASVVTPTSTLRCGTVSDLGTSSATKSGSRLLPSSRYSR